MNELVLEVIAQMDNFLYHCFPLMYKTLLYKALNNKEELRHRGSEVRLNDK